MLSPKSALWTETHQSVTTSDGLFSAILGSVSPLNLPFTVAYWLGIQVGTDLEMSPRQRITGAGYSINADTLDGLDSTAFAPVAHTHDDRYYTEAELNTGDGDAPNTGSNRVHWQNLGGVPASFVWVRKLGFG